MEAVHKLGSPQATQPQLLPQRTGQRAPLSATTCLNLWFSLSQAPLGSLPWSDLWMVKPVAAAGPGAMPG